MNIKISPEANITRCAAVGLNEQMFPVFLGLLLVTTIAWFFLSSRLYRVLQHMHPQIYRMLGKPKLFMRKSFATNFNVIRFLFKRGDEATEDQAVIRLCQGLRSLLVLYLICLAGSLALLVDKLL